jgi:hypothetical protein
MMLAAMRVVWGGVCERIRGSTSLSRIGRRPDCAQARPSGRKTRPSELFHPNCWISFEAVE